jgi:hypothetical protein
MIDKYDAWLVPKTRFGAESVHSRGLSVHIGPII